MFLELLAAAASSSLLLLFSVVLSGELVFCGSVLAAVASTIVLKAATRFSNLTIGLRVSLFKRKAPFDLRHRPRSWRLNRGKSSALYRTFVPLVSKLFAIVVMRVRACLVLLMQSWCP